MTDWREELIEEMAKAIAVRPQDSEDRWWIWEPEARAALAVAEPVIREQCANDEALASALAAFYGTPDEIKNETNRACMKKALLAAIREGGGRTSDTEMVLSQEITHLRAESEKLRALVEDAYREGWLDGSEAIPARKLHMVKDWNNSAIRAAIREGGKDE